MTDADEMVIPSIRMFRSYKAYLFVVACCLVLAAVRIYSSTDGKRLALKTKFKAVGNTELRIKKHQGFLMQKHANNVTKLIQQLKKRLALPVDALRVNHDKPCSLRPNKYKPCVDEACPATLADKSVEERITEVISDPDLLLTGGQLEKILSISSDITPSDVIIASAVSSNHFYEMQAMLKSLHFNVTSDLRDVQIVLFDLGLKDKHRKLTEKFCKCQIISFPFDLFPPHVSNRLCYSWKPLIMRSLVTKARKLLVWQDASVRWTQQFQDVFDRAEQFGHQYLEFDNDARVTANTLKQMFDYMKEEVCVYQPYREIQAGLQVMKARDELVIQVILNPLTRCALEESCICPEDPETVIDCRKQKRQTTLHRCHRFDQSALSILLSKLYAKERYQIIIPEFSHDNPRYVALNRGDKDMTYFSNLSVGDT